MRNYFNIKSGNRQHKNMKVKGNILKLYPDTKFVLLTFCDIMYAQVEFKLYSGKLFFVIFLTTCGFIVRPVAAASATKTFSNTYNDTNSPAQLPINTNRASSIRALNLAAKPTNTITGTGANVVSISSQAPNGYTMPGRLPTTGNMFKGLKSKISANYASQPSNNNNNDNIPKPELEQRISSLESGINTKQDILIPGTGIDITGNTISLSADIGMLPERMDELTNAIDDLTEQTQDYIETNYYTKEEINNAIGQIAPKSVANEFDPGFLLK